MDVRLPDGTIIQNIPEGTSKSDLAAKLHAKGYDVSKLGMDIDPETGAPVDVSIPSKAGLAAGRRNLTPEQSTSFLNKLAGVGETALTMGTAAISPFTAIPRGLATGEKLPEAMTGVTYQPRTASGRKFVENVGDVIQQSGVAGLGPLVEMQALSRAAPVAGQPLTSAPSQTLDKAAKLAGQLTTKSIEYAKKPAQALVAPFKGIKTGLYDPVVNQEDLIASTLTNAVGKGNVDKVIRGLERQAKTPGVKFSAAQATGNEGLAAIEDALKAGHVSGELSQQAAKNRQALANQLRNIAGDELAIDAAKNQRNLITEPLYEAAESTAVMGGRELDDLLSRANAAGALQEAKKIAQVRGKPFELPVIEEAPIQQLSEAERFAPSVEMVQKPIGKIEVPKEPMGLTGYLKKTGGINMSHIMDVTGERAPRKSGATVGLFTKNGRGLDDAVQMAVEGGYLPESALSEVDGGVQTLSDLIHQEISGSKVYPMGYDYHAAEQLKQMRGGTYEAPQELGQLAKGEAPRAANTVVGSRIGGKDLINLKKGIDQSIKSAQPGSPLARELMNLKSDYMNWLDSQSDTFLKANNKFAELSKPINQMQIGKKLSEKFIPATAEETPTTLNAAQLAKALQNKDTIARQVTGLKGAKLENVLTPKQLKTILDINSDASRMAEINKLGAGYGSPTTRRLMVTDFIGQNFRNNAPITSKILDVLNRTPIVNYATKGVAGAGHAIGKRINENIAMELDRLLASDPQGVANALRKELDMINAKQIKVEFNNPTPTMNPYLPQAAKLGVVLGNMNNEGNQ